jgi:hypothetical protein
LGQPLHLIAGATAEVEEALHMVRVEHRGKRADPLFAPIKVRAGLTQRTKDVIPMGSRGILPLTSSMHETGEVTLHSTDCNVYTERRA